MTLKPAPTPGDTGWFVHDRFGLFIHWGLYALAARHEWVKSATKTDHRRAYMKYFHHFDPDLYDPAAWADAAAGAGMKYFVITTKHHEGFCLWDTQAHRLQGPQHARRDATCSRPMVEAFRDRGLQRRLLPLADRLAPPGLHGRPATTRMRDERGAHRAGRASATWRATPSTCTARCASCSRGSARWTSCGSTSASPPGPALRRQGPRGLAAARS